ncbi:MAG: CopD family protein, partial [Alphaproteobacteria bacterium]|nr:CopD family protein [Alphaproteobacteria bacterium]
MIDWLPLIYPYVKAFHVMAVLSWMAGLFYLPRLYVYHAERGSGPAEPAGSFAIMEDKLLRLIMRPALVATWISGLTLVMTPGIVSWSMTWPWVKAAGVIAMTWFHMWCARERRRLAQGSAREGRTYRLMNEVPTLL